jgi:hypothetical protein
MNTNSCEGKMIENAKSDYSIRMVAKCEKNRSKGEYSHNIVMLLTYYHIRKSREQIPTKESSRKDNSLVLPS